MSRGIETSLIRLLHLGRSDPAAMLSRLAPLHDRWWCDGAADELLRDIERWLSTIRDAEGGRCPDADR